MGIVLQQESYIEEFIIQVNNSDEENSDQEDSNSDSNISVWLAEGECV